MKKEYEQENVQGNEEQEEQEEVTEQFHQSVSLEDAKQLDSAALWQLLVQERQERQLLLQERQESQLKEEILRNERQQERLESQLKEDILRNDNRNLALSSLPGKIQGMESLGELISFMATHDIPVDADPHQVRDRESSIPVFEESSAGVGKGNEANPDLRQVSMRKFDISDMQDPPIWKRFVLKDGDTKPLDELIRKQLGCTTARGAVDYLDIVNDLVKKLDTVRSAIIAAASMYNNKTIPSVWNELNSLQPLAALYFKYFLDRIQTLGKLHVARETTEQSDLTIFPINGVNLEFTYFNKLNEHVSCYGHSDLGIVPETWSSGDSKAIEVMIELKAPLGFLSRVEVKEKHQLLAQLFAMQQSDTPAAGTMQRGILTDLFTLYTVFLQNNEVFVSKRVHESHLFVRYILYLLTMRDPIESLDSLFMCKTGAKVGDHQGKLEDEGEDEADENTKQAEAKPSQSFTIRRSSRHAGGLGEHKPSGKALGRTSHHRPLLLASNKSKEVAVLPVYEDAEEKEEEYKEQALLTYNMYMQNVLKEPLVTDENLENRRSGYAEGKLLLLEYALLGP